MKAIILAAGKGSRLNPLTKYRPKHLLPIAGKPLIEHIIVELKNAGIEDIGLIVGYMKNKIMDIISDGRKYGVKVKYIIQEEPLGTANAIKMAEEYVGSERFIVVYGDVTFNRQVLWEALEKHEKYKASTTIVATEVEDPWNYGVMEIDEKGFLKNIVEKPEMGMELSKQVNTGIYVMEGSKIFSAINVTPKSKRGEYEITDTFKKLLEIGERIFVYNAGRNWWRDLGRPWDLLEANENYMNRNEFYRNGIFVGCGSIIGSECIIKPPTIIGRNCKIGSKSIIGPYAFIGDNVEIGFKSKISMSIVMEYSCIMNRCDVNYSVIGSNCIIEGDVKFMYEYADGRNVKMRIKGVEVDTGRRRMGSVIGDYSYIGCGSIIMPGITIYPNSIVTRNKMVYFDVDGFY
ncbi:MAG: sugar phosphate nucleotidyltransferase [Candidatus Methanomethylicia archaeon]